MSSSPFLVTKFPDTIKLNNLMKMAEITLMTYRKIKITSLDCICDLLDSYYQQTRN